MRANKSKLLSSYTALLACLMTTANASDLALNQPSLQEHQAILTAETLYIQPLRVTGKLPMLPSGIADLKFNEIFNMPVGPRGMEPSSKLLALNNKLVRVVGYMAKQETPTLGLFIMTPLAVNMGDEDDKFADDMPVNSIFVHVDNTGTLVHHVPGLITLIGVLSVGNVLEVDGRISYVQIKLDSILSGLVTLKNQALK